MDTSHIIEFCLLDPNLISNLQDGIKEWIQSMNKSYNYFESEYIISDLILSDNEFIDSILT